MHEEYTVTIIVKDGMVQDVFASEQSTCVNVIDLDLDKEVDRLDNDTDLKRLEKEINEGKMFSVW